MIIPKTLIFGSSFNPVHFGHLQLARALSQESWIKQVILLPCGQHAFDKKLAPAADRLQMLELALTDLPTNISISHYETDQTSGKSYTYQTLKALQKLLPHEELIFQIGSENLLDFSRWYEAEKLAQEFDLLVVERPGSPLPSQLPYPRMRLYQAPTNSVLPNVSSTLVREKIKQHQSIDELVPPQVAHYLHQKKLYL